MVEKVRLWLLPVLLLSGFLANQVGLLDVGYVYIKSYDMKLSELSLNWYPKNNDLFTAGESVTKGYNYEDGIISFLPDYNLMIENDLAAIAANREAIDEISYQNMTYQSGSYTVKLCLDDKNFDYRDSTLFKKVVYLNILGELELYDTESERLLLRDPTKKFWIRDSITIKGIAPKELLDVKMNEIWMAQACGHVTDFIDDYKRNVGSQFDYNYLSSTMAKPLESNEPVSELNNLLVPDFPSSVGL